MIEGDSESAELSQRLEQHFCELYERCMKDMPICNDALRVACVGLRPFGGFWLGVVITPWFMNLCAAPRQNAPKVEDPPGAARTLALPAGNVDFIATDLDGFDRLLFASLFSPMQDFVDQAAALATAQAALAALMQPAKTEKPPEPPKQQPAALDRRAFFRLGRRA